MAGPPSSAPAPPAPYVGGVVAAASCLILTPSDMATLLLPAHSLAACPRCPTCATRHAAWLRTKDTDSICPDSLSERGRPNFWIQYFFEELF